VKEINSHHPSMLEVQSAFLKAALHNAASASIMTLLEALQTEGLSNNRSQVVQISGC
jgi:hypothetical protein